MLNGSSLIYNVVTAILGKCFYSLKHEGNDNSKWCNCVKHLKMCTFAKSDTSSIHSIGNDRHSVHEY